MNQDEFLNWQRVTESSRDRWVLDLPWFLNQGTFLYYRGGETGVFIMVNYEGRGSFGNYSGAVPSISDAVFTTLFESNPSDDRFTSLFRVLQGLKVPELWVLFNANRTGRIGNLIKVRGEGFRIIPDSRKDHAGTVAVFRGVHRMGIVWPRREGFTHSRNTNEELDFRTIQTAAIALIVRELDRGKMNQIADRIRRNRS